VPPPPGSNLTLSSKAPALLSASLVAALCISSCSFASLSFLAFSAFKKLSNSFCAFIFLSPFAFAINFSKAF